MKLSNYVASTIKKYVAVDSSIGGIIVAPNSSDNPTTIDLSIIKTRVQDWEHGEETTFYLSKENALKLAEHLTLRANEIIEK